MANRSRDEVGLMAWCGGQTSEAVLGCTAEAREETEEKEEDMNPKSRVLHVMPTEAYCWFKGYI